MVINHYDADDSHFQCFQFYFLNHLFDILKIQILESTAKQEGHRQQADKIIYNLLSQVVLRD